VLVIGTGRVWAEMKVMHEDLLSFVDARKEAFTSNSYAGFVTL
jgi:hypothetical protein